MQDPSRPGRLAPLAATLALLLLGGFSCPSNGEVGGFTPPGRLADQDAFPATSTGSEDGAGLSENANGSPQFFVGSPTLSFEHVQPGVRSEFYVNLQAAPNPPLIALDANDPGPTVKLTLTGPGVMGEETETQPYEAGQQIRFMWSIDRFGTYRAEGGIYVGNMLEFPISEQLKVQ